MHETDGMRRRLGSKFKSSGHPHARPKNRTRSPLPHAQLGTLHTTQSAQLVPPISMVLDLEVSCQSNPGGWSCVVSGRSYVIAGSFVVSGCCASVLILVLDAGYDMHTYGAFSHKMRLAAKCAALLLYFSKISEYLTVAEIRILRVGRVF